MPIQKSGSYLATRLDILKKGWIYVSEATKCGLVIQAGGQQRMQLREILILLTFAIIKIAKVTFYFVLLP